MLTRQEQQDIEAFIAAVKAALKDFQDRPAQQTMIRAVSETLDQCRHGADTADTDGSNFLVCESGTGTGKTLGYAIPAIVMARSTGKRLILSSSTVALQSQLADKDLPFLQQHAPFEFTWAIVKGRCRYVCRAKLMALTDAAGQESLDLGQGDAITDTELYIETLLNLATCLSSGQWDGDRDRLTVEVAPELWQRVTNDRNGCPGNRCPDFGQCPFYSARQAAKDADVLVVNHDALLAALEMPPGSVLPGMSESFVVLDEGHILGRKVIDHCAKWHSARSTFAWLTKTPDIAMTAVHALKLNPALHPHMQSACAALGDPLRDLIAWLEQTEAVKDAEAYSFTDGVLPDDLISIGEAMAERGQAVLDVLADLRAESLKKAADFPEIAQAVLSEIGALIERAETLVSTWQLMLKEDRPHAAPTARWIEFKDGDHIIAASPINAGDRLERALWRRASAVIITSATLSSCGSLRLFLQQTGLDRFEKVKRLQLDSPFDYANCARIVVPRMRSDPGDAEAHTAEIIQVLPGLLVPGGSLVVFSSDRQLRAVAQKMPAEIRTRSLVQGELPTTEILRRHKHAIDAGESSVIFGLSGFSEGIDLRGRYCTHLVITKLSFSVPSSPWEIARRAWLERIGKNSFIEVTLPEAGVKLRQSVGRLIRTEKDSGTVTILDRRIVTKHYGRLLLQDLPPMKLEVFGRERAVAIGSAKRP
jgi:ATP-dependent DNA helicase DinG